MNLRSSINATSVRPNTACLRALKKVLRRLTTNLWQHIMLSITGCCGYSSASNELIPYQRLKRSISELSHSNFDAAEPVLLSSLQPRPQVQRSQSLHEEPLEIEDVSEETIVLKVSILGDCDTGKSSFMAKYVSAEEHEKYVQTVGVVFMEKVFRIQNIRIVLRIWDLGGDRQYSSMLPAVCQDAAAILFMFDLTRRSSLQSIKEWFLQARKWNNNAIPVLIGSKYDHFIDLPHDIQFAIIRQARLYAQAMDASLFFSSATHNINVHKIFKVIVAKLFDLPCNISKNVNFGEPIIDY